MTTTSPQLLIHEGELNEIINVIKSTKDPEAKVVGTLFGLWRNSLTQPVVQLTTGPGKTATVRREKFSPDLTYHESCKNYLKENHGLVQIGLWLSGHATRYPRLDPRDATTFKGNTSLMPNSGTYAVLMFVSVVPTLSAYFYIIDRNHPQSCGFNKLYREDILPGESCFRLLEPVSKKMSDGAKFYSKNGLQIRNFSKDDLPSSIEANSPSPYNESSEQQWYKSDRGGALLAKLINAFERNSASVEMSRSANSHDLNFEINGRLCLNFPRDFPESEPSISWVNERPSPHQNQDELCQILVHRVMRILNVI